MKNQNRIVSKNFNCETASTNKRIYASILDSLFLIIVSFFLIISGNEIFKTTDFYKQNYSVLEENRKKCYQIEEEAHIFSFSDNEDKEYNTPDNMNDVFARYAYSQILLSYDKNREIFNKYDIKVENLEGYDQTRASFENDQLAYFYIYYCPKYNDYNGKVNDIVNFGNIEPKDYFIKTIKDYSLGDIFLYDSSDEYPYLKGEIASNIFRYLFNEENLENGLRSYNYLIQTFKTIWEKQSNELTSSTRFLDVYNVYRDHYATLAHSISAISVSIFVISFLLIIALPAFIFKARTLGMIIFKLDVIKKGGYVLNSSEIIIKNVISLFLFYPAIVITMFFAGGNGGWMFPLFSIGSTSISMFNISAIMFLLPIINLFIIIIRPDKKSISDLIIKSNVVDTKNKNVTTSNDKKVDDYKEDIKANSNSSNEILDSTTFNNIER